MERGLHHNRQRRREPGHQHPHDRPADRLALYLAGTKFSLSPTGVVLYDQQVYTRITSDLPPYPDPTTQWNVTYTITDTADGIPIAGIPLNDPLTAHL